MPDSRRLRIAQLAPPVERVPPLTYGGTERVVSSLSEELTRRGHDVTLFASGDSSTASHLVPIVQRALWRDDTDGMDFLPYWAIALGKLASRIEEFDIVHNHLDYLAYPLSRLARCPVVTTLHGRLDLPGLPALYEEFSDVPLVSISDAQRRPLRRANWIATVYHGIDLGQFTFQPLRGNYLAYLGRISPDKGLDTAIRVARQGGWTLKLAARPPLPYRSDPNVCADWVYFEEVIRPLLDDPHVELVGEVAGVQRDRFLGGAAALLFPVCWPEPFGLVMPEALACGTPVLALNAGSVPEIIEDGVTGFVCSDADDLVEAVARLGELDRAACRRAAEARFSATAMVSAYERVYWRLVGTAAHLSALSAD
jgi:glycosyltransferase involved in cell wall biosynthesis